jgi:hypothetical protein
MQLPVTCADVGVKYHLERLLALTAAGPCADHPPR